MKECPKTAEREASNHAFYRGHKTVIVVSEQKKWKKECSNWAVAREASSAVKYYIWRTDMIKREVEKNNIKWTHSGRSAWAELFEVGGGVAPVAITVTAIGTLLASGAGGVSMQFWPMRQQPPCPETWKFMQMVLQREVSLIEYALRKQRARAKFAPLRTTPPCYRHERKRSQGRFNEAQMKIILWQQKVPVVQQ